jgi:hypothetical protein
MKEIDAKWRKCKTPLNKLYDKCIKDNYDKFIYIIPYSKQEWFKLKKDEQHLSKFKNRKDRNEGIQYCLNRQKELRYYQTKI